MSAARNSAHSRGSDVDADQVNSIAKQYISMGQSCMKKYAEDDCGSPVPAPVALALDEPEDEV